MDSFKVSKIEVIRFGWNTVLHNFLFFLLVLGIVYGVSYLPRIVDLLGVPTSLSIFFGVISWILGIILSLGVIFISLKFAKGEKPIIQDILSKKHLFFKYLISTILVSIITMVGFLLFVIPGIILAVRLAFFAYFIVDKEAGPIDAIKKSWNLTRGSFWNISLFGLLLAGFNILGALALLVGLIFTIPTTWVAWAVFYEKLKATKAPENLKE